MRQAAEQWFIGLFSARDGSPELKDAPGDVAQTQTTGPLNASYPT
jgi:hypothetical protein